MYGSMKCDVLWVMGWRGGTRCWTSLTPVALQDRNRVVMVRMLSIPDSLVGSRWVH
jgi:hypothetical protein